MATLVKQLPYTGGPLTSGYGSTANVQEYLTEICDFWDSVGFVRTADTGQFDPATQGFLTSGNFIYEVRKFTGAYENSSPIYVKIKYSAETVNNGGIRLDIGTGSNGSGTITGKWGNELGYSNSGQALANGEIRLAGIAGEYISFFDQQGGSYPDRFFVLGRSVNPSTGEPNGKGAMIIYQQYPSNIYVPSMFAKSFSFSADQGYDLNQYFGVDIDGVGASPNPTSQQYYLGCFGYDPSHFRFQHAVAGYTGEVGNSGQYQLENHGGNLTTYKVIPDIPTAFNCRILTRWE